MHWIDPDYLPKSKGIVDRFLINPQSDIDGIRLDGDMEVHVPPHLSGEIRAAVQPGTAITAYGVRPRHAGMIVAVAIEAGPSRRIVDNGPPQEKHGEHGRKEQGGLKHRTEARHAPVEA